MNWRDWTLILIIIFTIYFVIIPSIISLIPFIYRLFW